jgi:hypothetical protein
MWCVTDTGRAGVTSLEASRVREQSGNTPLARRLTSARGGRTEIARLTGAGTRRGLVLASQTVRADGRAVDGHGSADRTRQAGRLRRVGLVAAAGALRAEGLAVRSLARTGRAGVAVEKAGGVG